MHFFKRLMVVLTALFVAVAAGSFLYGSEADPTSLSPLTVKAAAPQQQISDGVEARHVTKHRAVKKATKKTAKKATKKATRKTYKKTVRKVSHQKAAKKTVKKAAKKVVYKKAAPRKSVKKAAKRVVYRPAPSARPNRSAHFNAGVEQQIVTLINRQRTSRGLRALKVRSDLKNFARQWSLQQYDNGRMSHGMLNFTYSTVGGQNVAYADGDLGYFGWAPIWDAAATVNAWMNSPAHRANILNPNYRYTGVGVVYGQKGANGWVFDTQDFAN